tara:strand:- start:530 stop:778 length:249 start_codon:yes stop_codon:yes gene_type:complete
LLGIKGDMTMFKKLYVDYFLSLDEYAFCNSSRFFHNKAWDIWTELHDKFMAQDKETGVWYQYAKLSTEDEKLFNHLTRLHQI